MSIHIKKLYVYWKTWNNHNFPQQTLCSLLYLSACILQAAFLEGFEGQWSGVAEGIWLEVWGIGLSSAAHSSISQRAGLCCHLKQSWPVSPLLRDQWDHTNILLSSARGGAGWEHGAGLLSSCPRAGSTHLQLGIPILRPAALLCPGNVLADGWFMPVLLRWELALSVAGGKLLFWGHCDNKFRIIYWVN